MTRRVRVLRRAVHDIEEIGRYIERDRPESARRVVERLLDALESLSDHAERGFVPSDERLRRMDYRVLIRDPYLIFYKVGKREVRVFRVIHGKRRYESLL